METWEDLARMVTAALALLVSIVVLRLITGRREMAQMTVIEVVLLAAVGLILGAVLVLKTPSLGEGLLALAVLVLALQLNAMKTPAVLRSTTPTRTSEPVLVLHDGRLTSTARRTAGLEQEIRAALQLAGYAEPDSAELAVLEPDGFISVFGPYGSSALAHCKVKRFSRAGGSGEAR